MFVTRPMLITDYDAVIDLWTRTAGVSVRDADSRDAIARYLDRNPGTSFVALVDDVVVGCILSGHDGRRGYLQHVAVATEHQRKGIGRELTQRCLDALGALGIQKFHLDVFKTNGNAATYWTQQGWTLRTDIDRYSLIRGGGANA